MTPEQERALAIAEAAAKAAAAKGAEPSAPSAPSAESPLPPANMTDRVIHDFTFGLSSDAAGLAHAIAGQSKAWLGGQPYDFGAGYQQGRAADEARLADFAAEHPVANAVGSGIGIVGNIAGTAGKTILSAPTLLGRVAQGMQAGAISGGLSGLGASDGNILERAKGGALGAGIGGAIGGVVPVVTYGAGRMAGRSSNPAIQRIARALTDDGYAAPADARQALDDLGPDAVIADLGPNLQRQAGAIASVPGSGQQIVRDALESRAQGANARIKGDLDAMLGPAPIPSQIDDAILASQRALGPEYTVVFQGARAVDTTPIANALDAQAVNLRGPAQKAVQQVRAMLNVSGQNALDPNPYTLFQTRQAIDGLLSGETNPQVVRVLSETRQAVDGLLARAVPGIKAVDAKYAELAAQRGALQRGQQVLDSGRTAPRPTELADEVAGGAIPQGQMVGPSAVPYRLSQGARAEIERIVGTKSNDVVALQGLIKGEGSWNRDRLATLFGADRADRIFRVLQREKVFADTAHVVMRNSETAARLAAQREVAPLPGSNDGLFRSILNLKAGDAAAKAADYTGSVIRGSTAASRQAATNERLAQLLMSSGGQGSASPTIQAVSGALVRARKGRDMEKLLNVLALPAPQIVSRRVVDGYQGR